jgi:selenophosphate synthetase-related protein
MMGMEKPGRLVTVFVKSTKGVTVEEFLWNGMVPYGRDAQSRKKWVRRHKDEFVLPEGQQEIVLMVKEVARSNGFEVEVIDVTEENAVRRNIKEHAKHIHSFPTLITSDGRRIEGSITRRQVEALLTSERKYL